MSPGGRRRRTLSEIEKALWGKVTESVTPLAPKPKPEPAEPPPLAVSRETASSAPKKKPAKEKMVPPPAAPALRVPAPPPLAPLEAKLKRRLSRGSTAVDARIDLHGLRQDEAQARLAAFLAGAQASGFKVVLVITGKGRPSDHERDWIAPERGVLRRAVPMWLSSPAARGLVIGFETAGPTHGGVGALYVRIRKRGR